ncbi:MAG: aminomethyl-transferring glycine dehydrogenase [Candidatus Riflebacteria bacterium HGW-Riflebacteria-2]|jgi:glycine dehydrogenase subunit 1|nr:MAG: aminomethyl-transferring glycine dehydrogenase [Candidatus Riflebacteria bacterium HGW-Riflebacteria-2]
MANYIPTTPAELQEMLGAIGVKTIEDLFAEIPPELRLQGELNLPAGMSEPEMTRKVTRLSQNNSTVDDKVCFLGGGAYDHIIPAAIDHLLLRGDFFTAYTPYQPEVSQGTLQCIYEFQSLISGLTGMDQANASMYEGATAAVEAINMATAQTRRNRVLIMQTVNPEYRRVMNSLNTPLGVNLVSVPFEDGTVDPAKVHELLSDQVAAVVMQYPNFLGCIEDVERIAELAHEAGALVIVVANPIALGLLETPGKLGADIVCGEGQPLGIPLSFGGPYVGFLAAKKALLRRMPGRIVGRTTDLDGKTGYVLTLQAREQHIRREKASSNICSNQALMALNATIYMSLMGREGIREVASQSFQKAHYLKRELAKVEGVTFPFTGSFFHELVVKIPNARKVLGKMAKHGIFAGIPLDNWFANLKDCILVAVTEKRSKDEIDNYCNLLGGFING